MADADGPFPKLRSSPDGPHPALARIGGATIADRLRSACEAIEGRLVFTTSFGIEDQLIAHQIFTERLPIEVVTLDTGRLFPSTYTLWQETEERYGVRIKAFYPNAEAVAALVADQGINGFYHSKDARVSCCNVRKVEPLLRALEPYGAWVSGIRREQSPSRAGTPKVEWSGRYDVWKIHPLADWSEDRVWRYILDNDIPYNPLHDAGYRSIGCIPCTRPTRPDEEERAGRWAGSDKLECGLHVEKGPDE